MKMLKSLLLILTSITLLSVNAEAQTYPDYVITVSGDSIPCIIHDGYQSATMGVPEKITTSLIKEFYLSKLQQLYGAVFKNDETKLTFLPFVEKGKINLYFELIRNQNGTGMQLHLSKGTDHVRLVKFTGFLRIYLGNANSVTKDDFALLLKDNPQVYNKFVADNDFSLNQVKKIVHLYNTGEAYDENFDGRAPIPSKDYLITPKNDTVFCRIRNDFFEGKFMFKAKKDGDFIAIDSTNAKEFFYSRDTSDFALIRIPGEPRSEFVKQLEKGKVNLYQKTLLLNTKNRRDGQSFLYINKGNSPLMQIGVRNNPVAKYAVKNQQLNIFFNTISDKGSLIAGAKQAIREANMPIDEIIRYFVRSYNDSN